MAVGRINRVTALTRVSFISPDMYGRFAGQKRSGRNNEVTTLPRWP